LRASKNLVGPGIQDPLHATGSEQVELGEKKQLCEFEIEREKRSEKVEEKER